MKKRLLVWFIETISEVLLLGVVLALVLGHDSNEFIKDMGVYASGVTLMFFTTGYLLSTVVVRALWRGQSRRFYPVVALVLFFMHFEILNLGAGGAFQPSDRLRVRVAGTFVVFACTLAGTVALGKLAVTQDQVREAQL